MNYRVIVLLGSFMNLIYVNIPWKVVCRLTSEA
jgi:hypothetical protein